MILQKRSRKGDPLMTSEVKPEGSVQEDKPVAGLREAAEDIFGAHASRSPQSLADSLKNFLDIYHHNKALSEDSAKPEDGVNVRD